MTRNMKRWTEDEEIYLITNYPFMTNKEISVVLKRNTRGISAKYVHLQKQSKETGRYEDLFDKVKALKEEIKAQKDGKNLIKKHQEKALIELERQKQKEVKERERRHRLKLDAEKRKYEEIYKNAIKEEKKNRDYGIGITLKNTNYIIGKTYIVKSSSKKAPDPFKGKLIQQTQDYIVLEGKYRQCYMKKDFLIGDYEIKEVRN